MAPEWQTAHPTSTPLAAPLFLDDAALNAVDVTDGDNDWAWSLSSKYASNASSPPLAPFSESATSQLIEKHKQREAAKYESSLKHSDGSMTYESMLKQPGGGRTPQKTGGILASAGDILVCGKQSSATGAGLSTATAGVTAQFLVFGYDRSGRPVLPVGLLSSLIEIKFNGAGNVTHKIEPLGDGSVRVWYTTEVSGKYTLKVGVRSHAGAIKVEPISGSPFTPNVTPAKMTTPRGNTKPLTPRSSKVVGTAVAMEQPQQGTDTTTSSKSGGSRSPRGSWRPPAGSAASASPSPKPPMVHASDIRLRAPRGLLAHAVAGEPARLELLAPLMGASRIELPGRMKIVLHLQSPWCDPQDEWSSKELEHAAGEVEGSLDGTTVRAAASGARDGPAPARNATNGEGRSKNIRERYFHGRIAFAPHELQPGVHQMQPPPGFGPPNSSISPPSVFDEQNTTNGKPPHHAISSKLSWGGQSPSLGGTLLFATFCVPRAGNYLVHVTLDQHHVSGSPLVLRVSPTEASASKTEAHGSALELAEAGKHHTVGVWLRDGHGNARKHSDEPVAGELSTALTLLSAHDANVPDNVPVELTRRHVVAAAASGGVATARASASVSALPNGAFAVGYTVRQAGVWALSIALDGDPIRDSPFAIQVWPSILHAPSCDVYGQLHTAIAGLPGEFEIRARDRFGNKLRDGGARLEVIVLPMDHNKDEKPVIGTIHDHGDGRYSGRYICTMAGRHAIAVTTYDGLPLYGSPFLLLVSPSSPCAERCQLLHPKTKKNAHGGVDIDPIVLKAGTEACFGLRLADLYGNPTPFDSKLLEISIDEIGIGPSGASTLAPPSEYTVRSLSEHYQLTGVTPPDRGGGHPTSSSSPEHDNLMSAGYASAAASASGSMKSPRKKGGATTAALGAVRAASAPGNKHAAVAARAAASGRAVSHALMSPRTAKDGNKDRKAAAEEAGSGVLLVRFYRAGEHYVHARLGAIELPGSPMHVVIEPAAVAHKASYIAHDALRAAAEEKALASPVSPPPPPPTHGAADRSNIGASVLTLLTADQYGNPVSVGGAAVSAKMSGPGACTTAVEDNGDGSYTVKWAAALTGMYRLSVLLGGGHVMGSPFGVHVEATSVGSPRLPAASSGYGFAPSCGAAGLLQSPGSASRASISGIMSPVAIVSGTISGVASSPGRPPSLGASPRRVWK